MKLTAEQIHFYNEKGYLIIENLFSGKEIDRMKSNIFKFKDQVHLPNVICDDDGDIRSVLAPHKTNVVFDNLYKDARLVVPSKQLIGAGIYLFQYKINLKKAFGGGLWEWHQDFPYWHLDDQIPQPNMTSIMILLQETRPSQGCLMVIPTSHKEGLAEFHHKEHLEKKLAGNDFNDDQLQHSLNNDLKYTLSRDLIRKLADTNGIVNIEGTAGTCAFFHPNIFHASNTNVSPYDRDTVIVTYNSVDNIGDPLSRQRPDFVCATDTSEVIAENFTS